MDMLKMVWMMIGPQARGFLINLAIAFIVWTVAVFAFGILIDRWLLT